MRGGVSVRDCGAVPLCGSSPRAWGCFSIQHVVYTLGPVFPTCVGVFLPALSLPQVVSRLPHVRGGVSKSLR